MVDLGSLVLLMSIFGWKVAIVYVILGLMIAVAGGTLIEKLHLEEQVEEFIRRGEAVKQKLLIVFAAICTVGIIIVGYGFNAIQYLLI